MVEMERETGFEPATSTLARSHSTTELLPRTHKATIKIIPGPWHVKTIFVSEMPCGSFSDDSCSQGHVFLIDIDMLYCLGDSLQIVF